MNEHKTDKLIDAAVVQTQLEQGADPVLLAARGHSGIASLAKQPQQEAAPLTREWTDEETQYLDDQLGVIPMAEIAVNLGRTWNAIKIMMTRLGLKAPSKRPGYLTGNGVANALGIDSHAIIMWHERGIIDFGVVPGTLGVLRIARQRLLRWAINPENWPYWLYTINHKIRHIPDEHISRLIKRQLLRWPDEWWTTGQAAKYHDVNIRVIARQALLGNIATIQHGHWYFKKSEVMDWHFVLKGRGHAHAVTPSHAADAFILLGYAIGLREISLSKLLTGISPFSRLSSMKSMAYIPEVIKRFDLPIQHDPATNVMFADWWPVRHRFPALWRSVASYHAGEALTIAQRLDLKAVLARWADHYAKTAKRKVFARKLVYGSLLSQAGLCARYNEILSWGIDPLHKEDLQL